MKTFQVTATFPQLGNHQETATRKGSRPAIAISRAVDEILSRPEIKRRSRAIEAFTLTVARVEEIKRSTEGK